ncbi:MAG: response regulator [Flavobacteriales bacterium]|nr:response regulator [Flavobacteriales bacterium]
MNALWQKIVNNGITKDLAFETAKRIRITNILLVILFVTVPFYLAILSFIKLDRFTWHLLLVGATHILAYYLISQKRFTLGRYICLGSMIGTEFYFFFLAGPGVGVEFFFFVIVGITYLISNPKERILCFAVLLCSITLYAIGSFYSNYELQVQITSEVKTFISLVNYSISISIIFLFLFFYDMQLEDQIYILDKKVEDKTVEIQETASRVVLLKDEFLSNMSHEIRTPMNAIVGMTDLLIKDSNLNKQDNDKFKIIKESSHDLIIILNNILELSMLNAGQIKAKTEQINLIEMTALITKPFEDDIGLHHIKSEIIYKDDLSELIEGNKNQINQILFNLIDNAYKFTTSGKVSITFSQESQEDQSLFIRCEVSDTGMGIKKEDQLRLFNPFQQLDQSSTKKQKGVGLGLIICQKLVGLLGGKIGVISDEDKGSTFWFSFPATIIEGEIKDVRHDQDPVVQTDSKYGLEVLVVDDIEWNQVVAQMMLEDLGCNVKIANNGLEAIEMFKLQKFDLVLMDIQMPEMDGIEATRIIKLIDNEIPVIAVSAYARQGDAEKFVSQGLDDYIHKPLTFETLVAKLNQWFKQSKLQDVE